MKKFISVVLCIITILSSCVIFASAVTYSKGKSTCIITVTTKANYWIPGSESITLSQTKGVCSKGRKESKQYGCWDVKVVALDGTHTYTQHFDGSSEKIKLKPNKVYNIVVTWSNRSLTVETAHGNFKTLPTWKVSSTYKCSSIA